MINEISSIKDERLQLFTSMTEAQLRNRLNQEQGVFIAESPKVIRVALQAGYQPQALLCEQKHIEGDARDIIEAHPEMPVYTGSREMLSELTGYTLTRGVSRSPSSRMYYAMPIASASSMQYAIPRTSVQSFVPQQH